MKKLLAIVLSLCLCLASVPALGASVVTIASDDETERIGAVAASGGVFYALVNNISTFDLVRVEPATRERTLLGQLANVRDSANAEQLNKALANAPKLEGLIPVDQMAGDDTNLYGVCTATGACYTLLDETGAFAPQPLPVTLDLSALIDGTGADATLLGYANLLADQGWLYYLSQSSNMDGTAVLGRVSLETGEAQRYDIAYPAGIALGQPGKLLVRIMDPNKLYSEETGSIAQTCEFGQIDVETGAYEKLGELTGDGDYGVLTLSDMVGAPAQNELYYSIGSKIVGLNIATGESRTSAYTGEGLIGGMGAMLAYLPGYMALGGSTGLSIFALDTDAVKAGALSIFGEYGTDAHKSFAKNYPDIPTEVSGNYQSDLETLTTAMVSGANAYDVLLLSMQYMPVLRLIEKGYCTPLNDYPEIMDRVADMDPAFVDSLTVDGKLYGVPVEVAATTYGVDLKQWEAIGLTEDDLPKTVPELYDFIANWEYDYADDYPDVRLFDYGCTRENLFSLMLYDYIYYYQSIGEELVFDTPLMRKMLTALEAIDFDSLTLGTDQTDFYNGSHLFIIYCYLTNFTLLDSEQITPMPLALDDGMEPVVGGCSNVLILNPRSQRKEDGVKYIANYLDHLDDSANIVLYPSHNDPVELKGYEKTLTEMQDQIAQKQASLDAAEESQKAALREELTNLQELCTEFQEKARYSISAEEIETFRNVYRKMLVPVQQSILNSGDANTASELNKIMFQYLDGGITQDQYLKQLDSRLRMIQLESK